MKLILYLSASILTIIFSSCKKDVPELKSQKTESVITGQTKTFLKEVKSDPESEYYISGEFDGYNLYCSSTFANLFPYHDTTFNAWYVDRNTLDNIHLIRANQERSLQLAIYFDQAKISKRQLPYLLPRANLDICEAAQIELINMKKIGTASQGSSQDNFSFWGHTNDAIQVQVTSLIDNIIEGTFEGSLTTKTGSSILVKNGKFRIKFIVVHTDKA